MKSRRARPAAPVEKEIQPVGAEELDADLETEEADVVEEEEETVALEEAEEEDEELLEDASELGEDEAPTARLGRKRDLLDAQAERGLAPPPRGEPEIAFCWLPCGYLKSERAQRFLAKPLS